MPSCDPVDKVNKSKQTYVDVKLRASWVTLGLIVNLLVSDTVGIV